MNFQEFYQKTENRLTDAILSLWATGDKEMQDYFKYLLSQEPIMADAIFQNTFPWEQSELSFEETTDVFQKKFINALDAIKEDDFRFPKDRKPYKHQIKSWKKLLIQKQSIAVTTGTGSGKTECFMLPVLQDIYENCKNQQGVNAIFLYPLNALIASQKKRMHAWCSALEGVNYALLTGDTPNSVRNLEEKKKALPQLISREQIRATPPQILFTNPTMLEYMLVRNADTPILEKSQGKLRWILLDEAHTLTGSKAAEMALLIRRVVTAFGVDIKSIRFAITSATVGNGNTDKLKKFMSDLCGISDNQIEVIGGRKVNNLISDKDIPYISDKLTPIKIKELRNDLLNTTSLSQIEIGKRLNISNKTDQLKAVDILADQKINGENLLPVRGHFFTRGIGGVYVCTNAECKEHKDHKPEKALGTMYTVASKKCSCGHPLLELVACRSCGNMMLEGERIKGADGKDVVLQKASVGFEAFHIEEDDNEQEETTNSNLVRFIKNKEYKNLRSKDLFPCKITKDNNVISGEDLLLVDGYVCPHCGNQNEYPMHFRISSAFTNRILSDIVLDQTYNAKEITKNTLYKGKKYISFTDSRQGTAKIAALINIDSESDWIRYQVYHYLLKKIKENQLDISKDELLQARAFHVKQLEEAPPFMKKKIQEDLNQINNKIKTGSNESLTDSRSSWKEIIDFIKNKDAFKTLFKKGAKGENIVIQNETYAKALLYDQFARRLQRERSLENLGLVNIVYPSLDNIVLPEIAKELSINLKEWKSLLKIAADYIVRNNIHFFFDDSLRLFTTKFYHSDSLHASSSEVANTKKWPSYNPRAITQSRLVLLLCAGLGWHNRDDITQNREDQLNDLLEKIWRILKEKVLTKDGEGYKLNFFEKIQFEIAGNEYLCPVSNRLIDKVFRGYSPWIKGNLEEENIYNYKIDDHKNHTFPIYDYPFHLNKENDTIHPEDQEKWLAENSKGARDKGLWNNLHERIFDFDKLYLAGEHSAQQDKKRLKDLELQFEKGEINILSCSTTMEMGVDIGGISAVVMSNVPPMPANYLQRTGRAGRRSENKSLALTFCAPNPIGLRTMNNPKWALDHKIAPPTLAFDSKNIVERHVNSLLFGLFIRHDNEKKGLNVKENIENFFFGNSPTIAENFLNWLDEIVSDNYKKELNYLVKNTPLQNISINQLILMVTDNFKKVSVSIRSHRDNYDQKLTKLEEEFGNNSPAYKAVNYRKGQFLQKFVLNYLAEWGFLPNAGLPTGIVDFEKITLTDLKKSKQNKYKTNPSYPISRALTEFAPGNNILIDGLNYKSSGIVMTNFWGQSAERNAIQACNKCGYQRLVAIGAEISDDCPKCGNPNSFIGIDLGDHKGSFTELVEPAGFSIDLYSTPTRAVSEKSKPQYLEPLLLNIEPWKQNQNSYLDFRTSENEEDAQILFYNTGNGEGYSLCLDCGRVENSHERLENHKRLRGGKDHDGESLCSAQNIHDHIILGSRFKTSFSEIRLKNIDGSFVNDKKLVYSLGVILTKSLAEHLAIEEAELGFGIKKYNGYQTIFIYDTAKGGAGYASQFIIYTKEILENAVSVLDSCSCQTACTKCLIDRSSQWHIEDLDRHLALSWLKNAISNQLPEALRTDKVNVNTIFGSLNDEIKRLYYHYGIKEINVHIHQHISDWEIDNLKWLENLKRDGIKVNIIVEGDLVYNNNQERLSVFLLSHHYILKKGTDEHFLNYKVHMSLILENGTKINYISKAAYAKLNAEWDNNDEEVFYRIEKTDVTTYKDLQLPDLATNNLYESRIGSVPRNTKSNDLAGLMISSLNNSNDLSARIKDKTFKVSYFDKYNQSEFSMRLILQFINQIKDLWSVKIEELNIHISNQDFRNYQYPQYIIHNYKESEDYEYDLNKLSNAYNYKINLVKEYRLPHYRYFNFESEDLSFSIRIDGGIAHGLKPVKRLTSEELKLENEVFEIRKDVSHDIIYNISFED